jgi:hypothetical protein
MQIWVGCLLLTRARLAVRQDPILLVLESPPHANFTSVSGGELLGAWVHGGDSDAAAQRNIVFISVNATGAGASAADSGGSAFTVVANVSASEQARARPAPSPLLASSQHQAARPRPRAARRTLRRTA